MRHDDSFAHADFGVVKLGPSRSDKLEYDGTRHARRAVLRDVSEPTLTVEAASLLGSKTRPLTPFCCCRRRRRSLAQAATDTYLAAVDPESDARLDVLMYVHLNVRT